ncbi:allophanate hydrolase subunit 1 [Shimia sp. FJ5]|uniref:5-oxoprolinase subunit B family protein n=1 Tax=Shimia sp. FJ5 TaxID=3079054 RepID=UPI00293DEDB4|nr:allophanate hydrolase subunit 1 [Shimia sp. FJ5]MDV4146673.1 allophanate hydrolase subunit 1 [Shimia sp. FJ5]
MAQVIDTPPAGDWPRIRTVGFDGMLVSFGETLNEPANRAALAFRAAVERAGWNGVEESATSLVSCFLRFDPLYLGHDTLRTDLEILLAERNWYDADLPQGRRLWRIPTVWGTDLAPQLEEAAHQAGLSVKDAIQSLSSEPVRVQTIGFAPGQPYLGELPSCWDIPRQQDLSARIPEGALAVAIRQFVLFSITTPTGWRHVGQTAIRLFRPESETPFVLRPGDEVIFPPVSREEFENIRSSGPDGGASFEVIR